jgi:hypothetical protein
MRTYRFLLVTAAVLLVAAMSLTASASAQSALPPTYTPHVGYAVLRDFGVPGTEPQILTLLRTTCAAMTPDQMTLRGLQGQLNAIYPGQGGDVMGVANDVYCPNFRQPLIELFTAEVGG